MRLWNGRMTHGGSGCPTTAFSLCLAYGREQSPSLLRKIAWRVILTRESSKMAIPAVFYTKAANIRKIVCQRTSFGLES